MNAINDALETATYDLAAACSILLTAHGKCNAVESIALLYMIERAEILRNDVAAFLAARLLADEGRG